MKMRQAFLMLLLFLIVLLSLTSCILIPIQKHYDIDPETVSSIEIYDLRGVDTYYSFFLESETPVYSIEEDQMADFLSDLSNIQFSDTIIITIAAVDPSFFYDDWVTRINYTDGSFSLISCDGFGESYDANDQVTDRNHFGCDNDEWKQFIGKYVPYDIFENNENE